MNLPKVYCIPGFGVNEKIFSNLRIQAQLQVINWIEPMRSESIRDYAKRMIARIDEDNPILLGVSFGGMIAIEIEKLIPVKQIILVSSVKCRREQPLWYRLAGALRLNKMIPLRKILQSDSIFKIVNRMLGVSTMEEQAFAIDFRRNTSLNYIRWSFDTILNWKNKVYPQNIIHIHGNRDKILPIATVHPTHIIKGGTHMMVFNRAAEISRLINEALAKMK